VPDAIEPPQPSTRWRRRRMLGWPVRALFLYCAGAMRAQPSLGQALPDRRDRAAFAARALALRDEAVRRGDQPYGAVVVRKGEIVGEGVSAVITDRDPTAHAEMVALRAAARRLASRDLAQHRQGFQRLRSVFAVVPLDLAERTLPTNGR